MIGEVFLNVDASFHLLNLILEKVKTYVITVAADRIGNVNFPIKSADLPSSCEGSDREG